MVRLRLSLTNASVLSRSSVPLSEAPFFSRIVSAEVRGPGLEATRRAAAASSRPGGATSRDRASRGIREVLASGSDPSIAATAGPGRPSGRGRSIVTPPPGRSSAPITGEGGASRLTWDLGRRPVGWPGTGLGDVVHGRVVQIPLLRMPEADRRPRLAVRLGGEVPPVRRRADRPLARRPTSRRGGARPRRIPPRRPGPEPRARADLPATRRRRRPSLRRGRSRRARPDRLPPASGRGRGRGRGRTRGGVGRSGRGGAGLGGARPVGPARAGRRAAGGPEAGPDRRGDGGPGVEGPATSCCRGRRPSPGPCSPCWGWPSPSYRGCSSASGSANNRRVAPIGGPIGPTSGEG